MRRRRYSTRGACAPQMDRAALPLPRSNGKQQDVSFSVVWRFSWRSSCSVRRSRRARNFRAANWSRRACSRMSPTSARASPSRPDCSSRWCRAGIPTGNFRATPASRPRSSGNLPPGWKAGPIQWPVPLKLNEPGGHPDLRLPRRGALARAAHSAAQDRRGFRPSRGRSQLARLRKNLHPGRRQGAVGSARRLASHSGEHGAFCEISRTAAASAPGERARHAPLESSA